MIFFDLGWTLEDESPGQEFRAKVTAEYCRTLGISTSWQAILSLQDQAGARGVQAVYPEALGILGLGREHLSILRSRFPWEPGLCRLYSEVPGVLETLSSRAPLGIIANQSRPMEDRLQAYGILRFFPVRVCSCVVGMEKPDLEIFHLASRLAKDPGPHWMVGDRVDNDIVPAKMLGWKTVRVVRGDFRLFRSRTSSETPDFEVPSLAEVPGLPGL